MALNYDEQMEVLADKLITGAIQDKETRLELMSSFSKELFRNENYILYSVLIQLREEHIVPDEEFLNIYLHRNKDLILKDNGQYIDKSLFDTSDEFLDEVIASTIETLTDYKSQNLDKTFMENIPLDKLKFKELYKSSAMSEIMEETSLILKDSLKIGRNVKSGVEDAQNHFVDQVARLNSLVTDESQTVYDIREVDNEDNQFSPIKIGDFGDLTCLNEYFGGIYTQMFYSVMAPTKGGKSKFCYRQLHNVSVLGGNNSMMWTAEGGRFKAKAELRAIHYVYYWEEVMNETLTEDLLVKPSDIRTGSFTSDKIRDMEHESKLDLENNENYGFIKFIDSPLIIDKYLTTIKQGVEKYKPVLLVVDYLQYMLPAEQGDMARLSKNERIGQSYMQSLAFCKEANIAFMTPAQMNQDGIKELAKGKEVDSRTLGGESAEIVRTPDYNIALYGTPEYIRNGHMKLMSIPSREAEPFPTQSIGVDLSYNYFFDANED